MEGRENLSMSITIRTNISGREGALWPKPPV